MLQKTIPSYHARRRESILSTLKSENAAILLVSNPDTIRNDDVHYPYRQDSTFFYFTGLIEQESAMFLSPEGEFTLFVRKRDKLREIWDGERYGLEGAKTYFKADQVFPIEELFTRLPKMLASVDSLYFKPGIQGESTQRAIFEALTESKKSFGRSGRSVVSLKDPTAWFGELRMTKQPEEVELLRTAGKITALAHQALIQTILPGQNEREAEAFVDYEMRRRGCERLGYPSIVAGGANATCLHYHFNNEDLKEGDLLLVDAGGEYGFYTADITRTFPIGRKFSQAQQEVYQGVLEVQKKCIQMAKPGITMPEIHRVSSVGLAELALKLGLFNKSESPEGLVDSGAIKRFFPHGTGHFLGMDVHDTGRYMIQDKPRVLQKGACFTIEPGFYIQPDDMEAPEHFRGIGIRIEDDILLTDSGHEVLTAGVVKEVKDIESLRAQALDRGALHK